MYDPITAFTPMIAEEHQKNLLKEAQYERLLNTIRITNTSFPGRFLVRVGGFLISAGRRLQKLYKPTVHPGSKAYQSGC
jgi:hypothetical protein